MIFLFVALKFKKTPSIVLFSFFLITFFYLFLSVDENITRKSLSAFSRDEHISFIYNSFFLIMALLIYLNSLKNMYLYVFDFSAIRVLNAIFKISTCMVLIAIFINTTINESIHNITAFVYFVGYTIAIFFFGYRLLGVNSRVGIVSIVVSICSFVFPIVSAMIVPGLAIAEIIHTFFICFWDLLLVFLFENKRLAPEK